MHTNVKVNKHQQRSYFDLLYSNSICRQSSMPTSIFMLLFMSGYWESVWTTMSCSFTTSVNRFTIVTRRKYLKEGNILFNNALNTFYLRLYGVRHMVKDHSDSERRNPLPPHRLLFPISSKGSFICIIPQTG